NALHVFSQEDAFHFLFSFPVLKHTQWPTQSASLD
ncbi:unnamed protein product, partial [marine sediment metagenome]